MATQRVRVFNENVHPLVTQFKGEKVSIKPRDYWREESGEVKVMDIFDANDFRGQYHPAPIDEGTGRLTNDPRFFKMVKLEHIESPMAVEEPTVIKCMAPECKYVASTEKELITHSKDKHAGIETLILPEQDVQLEQKKKKHV